MRKFFIAVFIVCMITPVKNIYSQHSYWVRTNDVTDQVLRTIYFINNNTGWISGDSGTIVRTTNGGTNWIEQQSGIFNSIENIFFLNERLGWAIAWEIFPDSTKFPGTIVLKTTNGGNNWIFTMHPDTNIFLRTILFLDSLRGFAGGFPSALLLTSDAGNSWINAGVDTTSDIDFPIQDIKFINSQTGYAGGGSRDIAGVVWKTTNGGHNWSDTVVSTEPLTEMAIINSQSAIGVGGDFEFGATFVETRDQGANWEYHFFDIFGVVVAVDFRTEYEGWGAITAAKSFILSLDSGNTWEQITTTDNTFINDIFFSDSTNGWAVGNVGVVLRYSPKVDVVQSNENILTESFMLYQNYPNPFNPSTIIKFDIPSNVKGQTSNVKLLVYDILGNEIAKLVDENLKPGSYSTEFDGTNLSSGIYYYQISVDDFLQSKKMILLK